MMQIKIIVLVFTNKTRDGEAHTLHTKHNFCQVVVNLDYHIVEPNGLKYLCSYIYLLGK